MAVEVKDPVALERYVDPDTGRLTLAGLELLQRVVSALRDHEDRIEALEP
jgi:hypothetical protein